MGLFDIGGSRSESNSSGRSDSSSFDNVDQVGFNFGRSSSVSAGDSSSRSRVAFEDVFSRLFGNASEVAGAVDTGGVTGAANRLFESGGSFLEGLSEGGAGASFLKDRLASRDGVADDQTGFLADDISKFVAEDLNPAITSGGVAAGTLGGSRGEVQRGAVSDAALREFSRGSVDIRSREQDRRDSLATNLAADESGRAGTALSSLPSLFGLAQGGANAGLDPFLALSQILGGPAVLQDSDSSQLASSLGLDVGFSSQTGRAGSTSRSRSDSSSSSGSFSFGF